MVLLILTVSVVLAAVICAVCAIKWPDGVWKQIAMLFALLSIGFGMVLLARGVLTSPDSGICRVVSVKLPEYVYQEATIECEFNRIDGKKQVHDFSMPTGKITGFDANCQAAGRDCGCLYLDRHFWIGEYELEAIPCPDRHQKQTSVPTEQP